MSQPLLIAILIGAYFLLLLLISHFASHGADSSTFFAGNRRMPWPLVAIAMICAPISGVTFISVPGMVVTKGFTYLQMCLGFIIGYFIIAWVLLPLFYRNNISIYSFLGKRYGTSTYKTGAWLFMVSKILGTSVRFMVICMMLQLLVFQPVGLPFSLTTLITLALVWIYTVKGGVKAVIWTDLLKCCCLITSVILCIVIIAGSLEISLTDLPALISHHSSSHIFNFNNPFDDSFFPKQFIAGIFLVVAMTGLDQDMMQHALSCRDVRSSKKNMILSSFMQFIVITLFLSMGTLLLIYALSKGIELPEKSDNLFATVAFHDGLPLAVGVFFVIGLVSATYSSVGSAMTSLTTSFSIDILQLDKSTDEKELNRKRRLIHTVMAAIMGLVIILFYHFSHEDAISAVFTLASYTYGPILGLFIFGMATKRKVNGGFLPFICLLSPLLALVLQWWLKNSYGYQIGFELLLVNASFTIIGLGLLSLIPYRQRNNANLIIDND